MNNILELKNIKKSYKVQKNNLFERTSYINVIDNISLSVKKGEIFGLVGPSGSGKSTLANIIVRLIKDHEGEVFFDNKNITNLSEAKLKNIRKDMQIVFQNTYSSLNPTKKVKWILKESLFLNKKYKKAEKEEEEEVEKALKLVGLKGDYKERYTKELSGGEKQRVCIASAIILQPKLIIADEAVSSLDVYTQSQILDLFLNLKENLNLSYIFISHDLNIINYISDKIAIINKGKIIESGNAYEIYNNPKTEYTKKLYDSIPKL